MGFTRHGSNCSLRFKTTAGGATPGGRLEGVGGETAIAGLAAGGVGIGGGAATNGLATNGFATGGGAANNGFATGGTDGFATGGTDGFATGGTDGFATGGTNGLATGGTDGFAIAGTGIDGFATETGGIGRCILTRFLFSMKFISFLKNQFIFDWALNRIRTKIMAIIVEAKLLIN